MIVKFEICKNEDPLHKSVSQKLHVIFTTSTSCNCSFILSHVRELGAQLLIIPFSTASLSVTKNKLNEYMQNSCI